MFPPEINLTQPELDIIFRIRQLIGDSKEMFIDDVSTASSCTEILASGTTYKLQEAKGYPTNIYVNDVEYIVPGNPQVIGYKFLKFSSPVLTSGAKLTVFYEHFRHSDTEILDTYDIGAFTYLNKQCNLTPEIVGIDLLILATAYILLQKDLAGYIAGAISLADSDSKYDASRRPAYLQKLLDSIANELRLSLTSITNCQILSLPVFKVE